MAQDVRRAGAVAITAQLGWLAVVVLPWIFSTGATTTAAFVNLLIPIVLVVLATPLLTRYHRARVGIARASSQAWWRGSASQIAYHLFVGAWFATLLVFTLPSARVWRSILAADGRWAGSLLALSTEEDLALRLERATAERAAAVEGGLAERRRLERDLHDGVQQGLVSVGVELALLRNRFPTADPELLSGLAAGTDRINAILGDLRAVVRGIRPPILDERGLDAAISGLVAAVSATVDVRVTVPHRLPEQTETTAYFVVAEAVTNVVKHSGASRVSIEVAGGRGSVRVAVRDDGRGGAEIAPAGGLAGVVHRVRSTGGWVDVSSPVGGPTVVTAEVPCE